MADLGTTLGKQIGPLPLGAWIAVVGGGLGIAWYAQRSRGSAPADQQEQQLTDTGVGEGTAAFIPAAAVTSPVAPLETLDDWINKAVSQAASFGATPLAVEQALRLYAKGESLNTAQQRIVNLVITTIGPAPAGEITEPPILQTPAPTPTPTSTAPTRFVFSSVPDRYRQGRSVVFQGRLLKGSSPVRYGTIRVFRRRISSQSWAYYKLARTDGSGRFAVTTAEPRVSGTTSYQIQFRYGSVVRSFTLRQS